MAYDRNVKDICSEKALELTRNSRNSLPAKAKEEIAEIFISDLTGNNGYEIRDRNLFIQKYGIFYPIFHLIHHSDEWKHLKEIALESPEVAGDIVQKFLNNVFDFLAASPSRFSNLPDNIDESLSSILMEFMDLLASSQDLWGRHFPDKIEPQDPNQTNSDALAELSEILEQLKELGDLHSPELSTDLDHLSSILSTWSGPDDLKESVQNSDLSEAIQNLKEIIATPPDATQGDEPDEEGEGKPGGGEDEETPSEMEGEGKPGSGEDDGTPTEMEGEGKPGGGEDDGTPTEMEGEGKPGGGEDDGTPSEMEGEGKPGGGEDDGTPSEMEGEGKPGGGEDDGTPSEMDGDDQGSAPEESSQWGTRQGEGEPSQAQPDTDGTSEAGKTGEPASDQSHTEPADGAKNDADSTASKIEELSATIDDILEQESNKEDSEQLNQPNDNIDRFLSNTAKSSFLKAQVSQQILKPLGNDISAIKPHIETIEFLTALYPGRGMDLSMSPVHATYINNLERYAAIVQKNDDLKKMVELFGRIELEYGLRKISISPSGKTEMHSVTLSNDISRMLPMEASKLHHPTLRKKFYADLTEGRLLSYQLRGKHWADGTPKKRKRGPVVAMVDTSGSMSGAPETLAKAIILAITKRMLKDRRDVKVILFSGPGCNTEIELTSRRKMADTFLQFIQQGFRGGTDFNTALRTGLDSLSEPEYEGADLLFITDGLGGVTDRSLVDRWTEFKETKDARIFSCIVGNDDAGGLNEISDNIYYFSGNGWAAGSSPAHMIKIIQGERNVDRI
ncbi:hypothetical protein AZH53_09920 [Methanomicrobiaceae archaeon CYW5]|uniref:VWA domain-containing protein n=1 Tax=Methanovulcanius yangii TaxID=1789227 RepID=UPI0029C9BCD9|nr:VWA domain-containing protein [Methanovulcanius yangii]MBT8508721.1 hypothetical protein [Methanovulcanius yangii]